MMDIYQVLKKDHEEVRDLIEEQIESHKSGSGSGADLMAKIASELSAHMESEEKILYSRLEEDEGAREKILESYEEHHVAKEVLKELGKTSKSDDRWLAKLKVMKELVDHHVEEEEKHVFKAARKFLNKEAAQEIAEKFMDEKKHILEKSKRK
jgi:hemerythrin superfamily protein